MFIIKKKINNKDYYYARKSLREEGKVKSKDVAYLGKTKKQAEEKLKKLKQEENLNKQNNKKIKEQNKKQKMSKEKVEEKQSEEEKKIEKQVEEVNNKKITIEELASFCKRKGFVFNSSEIYGGFSGFWDFGPLGTELFNNIKQNWWKFFVQDKKNMTGIQASIISHPRTWKASGHIDSFADVAVICEKCKKSTKLDKSEVGKVKCDCGGDYKSQGEFSLMFKTSVGALNPQEAYLRGETAQGMFLDFKNIYETGRYKLPFGIAQIGKCFRNEIAPRDFLFRSREFTIAEFEFFIHPEETKCSLLEKKHLNVKLKLLDAETQDSGGTELKKTSIGKMLDEKRLGEWHAYWLAEQLLWFDSLGLLDNIKVREHTKDELSHYSSATFDMDFMYAFGSKEVAGNANRGQYDLSQHEKESKKKMSVFDEVTKKKIIPRVIEPTFGMERVFLAILNQAYEYDKKRENIVLKIPSKLAPFKAAVLPIVKNDEKVIKFAKDIFDNLIKDFHVDYDESGSLGRRYSRQDEQGTPFCITIDNDTLNDNSVTIRNRDTTKQIRIKIQDIKDVLRKLINEEVGFEKSGKVVETRK